MDILKEILLPYAPVFWKMLIGYIFVLIAVIADLWAGIKKSKKNGTYQESDPKSDPHSKKRWWIKLLGIHSYGVDRTMDKLRRRYNLLIVISLIDFIVIICEFNEGIPYATLIASLIMCVVELFSIFEKDEDKGRYKEATRTAAEMWKGINKEELADVIIERLKERGNESN